jgi:hypothetical protein
VLPVGFKAHPSFPVPGNFSVEVYRDQLLVPTALGPVLELLRVRTAESFLSYLRTFPSEVASILGWSVGDVRTATARLTGELKGVLPEKLLDGHAPPKRSYGALNPAGLVFSGKK